MTHPKNGINFMRFEKLDDLKAFIVYGFREYHNHGIIYFQNQGDVYEDTHDLCRRSNGFFNSKPLTRSSDYPLWSLPISR